MTHGEFHTKTHRRWRRNGRTQTWVRQPDKFRIPVKHGLYSYGQLTDGMSEMHCICECDQKS